MPICVVRNQQLGRTTPGIIAAKLPVMHEAPFADHKGMAIVAAGRGAGRRPHMSHEQMRFHRRSQTVQIRIGPGWHHVPIKPRLIPVAVPGDTETIRIDRGGAACRAVALPDQRMSRPADDVFQIDRPAQIGRPATHFLSLFVVRRNSNPECVKISSCFRRSSALSEYNFASKVDHP